MFAKLEKAEKDAKDSNATMTKLNAQVNQLEKEKTEVMKEVEDLKRENQNATDTLLAYMTKCDDLKTKQSELLSKCKDNHLKTITMINEANDAKKIQDAKNAAEQYAQFAAVSKEKLINETQELLLTIDTLDALKKDD
jgi:chromosome segregation ATPase